MKYSQGVYVSRAAITKWLGMFPDRLAGRSHDTLDTYVLVPGAKVWFTTLASRHTPSPASTWPKAHPAVSSHRSASQRLPCASSPSSSSAMCFLALVIIRRALPSPSSSSAMRFPRPSSSSTVRFPRPCHRVEWSQLPRSGQRPGWTIV